MNKKSRNRTSTKPNVDDNITSYRAAFSSKKMICKAAFESEKIGYHYISQFFLIGNLLNNITLSTASTAGRKKLESTRSEQTFTLIKVS